MWKGQCCPCGGKKKKKSCWFRHIELLMPSNFLLTAVKRCFTSNQSLPHESRRAAACTLGLGAEQVAWWLWEWLWIRSVCVHVHVLHAYVGVHAPPYTVCRCSRWQRKWAGTTRGDCACASRDQDWLVPVTDWRGLLCDPPSIVPPTFV